MATATRHQRSNITVLHRVPYKVYARLVEEPANYHLRMAYHDGTLEIVSPIKFKHEIPSVRLFLLVTTVAEILGVDSLATGSGTFKKGGEGPFRGKGKEPDQSFYFANAHRFPRDREPDLNAGDPPPDLWIEVDNRVSSAGRLPVYVALGVPEVWRYRVNSRQMQFLRLVKDRYEVIKRSLSLPILTPALVQDALAFGVNLSDTEWVRRLREWARPLIEKRGDGT